MCIFFPRRGTSPAGFSRRRFRIVPVLLLGQILFLAAGLGRPGLPFPADSARAAPPDIRIPGEDAWDGDTGGLRVVVDLPAATVYLDGELAGLAHPDRPLVRPVWPAGEVRVTVRAEGVDEAEQTAAVRPGETAEVQFRIRPRPPEVRRHLAQGAAALAQGRLSAPAEGSAVHHFRRALALEPDLPEAREGLREVLAAHRRRGETAESAGDFRRAKAEYQAGLKVARLLAGPADPALYEAFETLAAGRDRAALLARPAAELLREADALFDRERYLAPPGENAFELYRAALVRSPDDAHARERIRDMAGRYGDLSVQREGEDLSRAANYSRNRARLLRFLRDELALPVDPAEISASENRAETLSRRAAAAEELAREGDAFLVAQRLLTPERGNAFQKYREALAEDPTNRRARERLGEMVQIYRERAESAFEAGQMAPARQAYERLSLVAEFAGSVFSDGEIDAAAETARRNRVALEVAAERVAAGDLHRAEGRWVRPEDDSALSAYREALERHPGNLQALSGLRALMTALNEAAEAAAPDRPGEAAEALSDFILVARAAAAADPNPDLRTAAETAEIRIQELRIQSRNQRLSRLRERLDRDMERYRNLAAREIEDDNVAGQVAPVLRRMVETLADLAAIYDGLPGPEMENKRNRLRQTQAVLERELRARAEKAF